MMPVRVKRWMRRGTLAVASCMLAGAGILAAVVAWPMDTAPYLRLDASTEMLDRHGRTLFVSLNRSDQWCMARDLNAFSPRLIEATVAAEDQRFWLHPGIDPIAVARAVRQNYKSRGIASGASTITMQIVKRVQGNRRSLTSKAAEALDAVRLTSRIDRKAVLETYLNTAPYGLNLIGCEAAARRYFGKSASEVTTAEAALLAGLPKAPADLLPLKHPERAVRRRNYVLARMYDEGFLSREDYEEAKGQPLNARWHDFPNHAPHLARRLAQERASRTEWRTTLDRDIQLRVDRLLARTVAGYGKEVRNGAVLVVDVPAAAVLAHAGSVDFFSPYGGQVDVARSPRSPGSALKPFTYALAIESNKLYPCEMLYDYTLDYGLYSPGNYDNAFHGLVTARHALRSSLNVPAVTVLERLGYSEMHRFLTQCSLTTLVRPAEYYGLGLTLGNCEVRMEELAAAYCMLAALGEHRPLRYLDDKPEEKPRRCLSRGTCLALYEMMEQPLPSEFGGAQVEARAGRERVCWKTGTSTGQHDAWAFVFNAQYLVAVWLGNNDGSPSPLLVGGKTALPLAARIFRALPQHGGSSWPSPGSDLREVQVCASSGLPATPWCLRTRRCLLPRNAYLNRRCDVHYPLDESGTVGERWPGTARRWDLARIESAPGDRAALVPTRDTHVNGKPPVRAISRTALRILAPADQAEYILTREKNGDRIRLACSENAEAGVHWYLDGEYLGQSRPGRPLYLDLTAGEHRAACMSEGGAVDTAVFRVLTPP